MPVLYVGCCKSKAFCQACVPVSPRPAELQEARPASQEVRLSLTRCPGKTPLSFKGIVLLLRGQSLGQPWCWAGVVAFGPAAGQALPAGLEDELLGFGGWEN